MRSIGIGRLGRTPYPRYARVRRADMRRLGRGRRRGGAAERAGDLAGRAGRRACRRGGAGLGSALPRPARAPSRHPGPRPVRSARDPHVQPAQDTPGSPIRPSTGQDGVAAKRRFPTHDTRPSIARNWISDDWRPSAKRIRPNSATRNRRTSVLYFLFVSASVPPRPIVSWRFWDPLAKVVHGTACASVMSGSR
jgi:hypothetical protein